MFKHSLSCFSLTILLCASSYTIAGENSIEGIWLTADGDGWIEFRLQDGRPSGFIAGSPNDPGNLEPPDLDENNPDPVLRDRPLFGLEIFHSFQPSGENTWQGRVYDPNTGKTYKCKLILVDANTLKVRGYLGFSLFGKTQVWTRRQN